VLAPDDISPAADRFPTTHWSRVFAAGATAAAESDAALAELCAAYWYPVYAFVRREGYDADAALDLVQGFFADLLERGELSRVEPTKGRFRSLLKKACSNYLSNRRDHDRALKRGGGRPPISIDVLSAEGGYLREPCHGLTAEKLFERRWATTLLGRVLDALGAEMAADGKSALFQALRPALLGDAERTPYARIATDLGISEEAARAAAYRLRGRYRDLLRIEVASTLDDPSLVEEEIRALFNALGG
jgi:DNA-directed RNA polymerase specialized sigma24 family protein